MSEKLIAEVARIWVDGGGDAEGIDWCYMELKKAITIEIENRIQGQDETDARDT